MTQAVPNKLPKLQSSTHRLAVIGEAPGQDEETLGEPFVGASGRLLKSVLANCGVASDQVFFGNVCQIRPSENDITNFDFYGPEIQSGLISLRNDLANFKPNCILALGRTPLRALCPSLERETKQGIDIPISNYRGSILESETDIAPLGSRKLVACYHPSYILRQFSDIPLFKFDVARAVNQSKFPEIRRLTRAVNIRPTLHEVLTYLRNLKARHTRTAFDIEGYTDNVGVTMLSIATSPVECLVIPFYISGQHYWSEDEEAQVWAALADWLYDEDCPKICQNATYELFVLAWSHRCRIAGIVSDTMFKHFELFPELEKSLALQTSIYTEEPFYKDERTSDNPDVKLLYNGKDSCVTIESDDVVEKRLRPIAKSYDHFSFNVSLLPSINYMALRGCKFDQDAAQNELTKTKSEVDRLNNTITAQLGREFNVKSVPDKQWLLYDFFGYTPYAKHGRSTKEEVLLRFYAKHRHPILKSVIDCISVRTRISDINKLVTDADGRIRSNYNLVGTNTGRLSSSGSSARIAYFTKTGILKWDFTGTNLQNVTKDLRICFIPDSQNLWFWQCDLSGADGWTVAADLAAIGHNTMLDDYLAGIKPAKVLLLMLEEYEAGRDPASINKLDRVTLRARTKALKFPDTRDAQGRAGDWKYLCMKRVQHGTNYGMEPDTLSATIFKDSEGTIDLTAKESGLYQYLYKLRYNPTARNEYIKRELGDKGYLQSASGLRRQFFGIRNRKDIDHAVLKEALAFEPQANTTYVCNLAMRKLWYDPQNRTPIGTLFIEPLLQIHDAMAGQFPKSHADWAVGKLRTYFDNSVRIHGIDIKIPFEGGYGPNWKETHEVEFS